MATVNRKVAVVTSTTGRSAVTGNGARFDRPWQVPTHLSFVFASHGRRQAYRVSEAVQEEPAMLKINQQMRGPDADASSPLLAGRPAVTLGVVRSAFAPAAMRLLTAGGCRPAPLA
jgi:hypothetical protein